MGFLLFSFGAPLPTAFITTYEFKEILSAGEDNDRVFVIKYLFFKAREMSSSARAGEERDKKS